jgi:hypothetical protein
MTQISDVTTNLHTIIAATLPGYVRIPDSIDIEDNSETYLRQGYALVIGDSDPTTETVKGILDQQRTFGVSLTQQVFQTDHNASGIQSAKLGIMEDAFSLVKELHLTNDTINDSAIDCNFVGDDGVSFLETDRAKYYLVSLIFTVRYRENLLA